jgi:A/G-specific adenine glycosylase
MAHGRHGLPWQNSRDPYLVWVSEIMLQQTQVATVVSYFPRFLNRFPTIASLAAASLDDVLGLWSGLGYYSRARNLHKCALDIMSLHQGDFPRTAAQLQTLAGIGRSTAGAIASLCFSQRVAILDGNAKRVLTRMLGFDLDLSVAANQRLLWDEATNLLPTTNLSHCMPRYTQGMMDLGATVCTIRSPSCNLCPLKESCVAKRIGQPENYPVKTRKIKRSSQAIWLLWAQTQDRSVWLSKRPTPGVWAGLYCFPLFENGDQLAMTIPLLSSSTRENLPSFVHVLTHKDLRLHPVRIQAASEALCNSQLDGRWVSANEWPKLGLPAPVRNLLQKQ